MSDQDPEELLRRETIEGLRRAREEARGASEPVSRPHPSHSPELPTTKPLPSLGAPELDPSPASPDRDELNVLWSILDPSMSESRGRLSRWFSFLRGPLRRIVRFALGPALERQVRMNSAQVRFDNELVRYVDERFDRTSRHYDRILGLHGRRMEEVDERHLILQQELVRHVHDLVARIELAFEAAEQNHLYLEGMLRETREELTRLSEKLGALAKEDRH